jgi:Sec-independent protein translocase protein TatA
VSFGTEILFIVLLGLLVLGPKQMKALLVSVPRAKAQLENARRDFKSKLAIELDTEPREGRTNLLRDSAGGLTNPSQSRDT